MTPKIQYTIIQPDEGEGWAVITTWRCYDDKSEVTRDSSLRVFATDEDLKEWFHDAVLMEEERDVPDGWGPLDTLEWGDRGEER